MPAWKKPCCWLRSGRYGSWIVATPGSTRVSTAPISFIAPCRAKLARTRASNAGSAGWKAIAAGYPRSGRVPSDEERGVRVGGRLERGFLEPLAQRVHVRVVQAHGRATHRAAVETVQPALELPQHAVQEQRLRHVGVRGLVRLARRMDLPVEARRLVVALLLEEPEDARDRRPEVLGVACPAELHRRELRQRHHVGFERTGDDDLLPEQAV